MEPEIIEKLKRHRVYLDSCIRPYPFDPTVWIAEVYIAGRMERKTWKIQREERSERSQSPRVSFSLLHMFVSSSM